MHETNHWDGFFSYLHLLYSKVTESVPGSYPYKYEEIQFQIINDNAATLMLIKPISSFEEHSKSPESGSETDKSFSLMQRKVG